MPVVGGMADMEPAFANRALKNASPVLAFLFLPDRVNDRQCQRHFLHAGLVGIEFSLDFIFRWELEFWALALRPSVERFESFCVRLQAGQSNAVWKLQAGVHGFVAESCRACVFADAGEVNAAVGDLVV
jgi:hypothetical protein